MSIIIIIIIIIKQLIQSVNSCYRYRVPRTLKKVYNLCWYARGTGTTLMAKQYLVATRTPSTVTIRYVQICASFWTF